MSAEMINTALIGPASRFAQEKQDSTLAAATEELAGLRFSILLSSAWEASDAVTKRRRGELRTELSRLRGLYLHKVDEIAMSFGVQAAMEAKDEVELTVDLPAGMEPPMEADEDGRAYL